MAIMIDRFETFREMKASKKVSPTNPSPKKPEEIEVEVKQFVEKLRRNVVRVESDAPLGKTL